MKYIHFLERLDIQKGITIIQFSKETITEKFINEYDRYNTIDKINNNSWSFKACRSTTEEREAILNMLNAEFKIKEEIDYINEENKS